MPVLLFHGGFNTFSGGFVGVDVFFVISGYLITSLIIRDVQDNTFSLAGFYERRVRRIFPALFFVMAVCIPFAWFWMTTEDIKEFSKSLVAISFFSSNIFFWRETGYFANAAELKPLLHTWSLSVEEQFYFIFPIAFLLIWKLGKRWMLVVFALVAMVSLVIADWGAVNKPEAAFFLLPTRAWELLVGVFAAFYLAEKNVAEHFSLRNQQVLAMLGIVMILYAVFAYDKSTPFPGLHALVPAIGAVLVIVFGTPSTIVGSLLGSKILVGVGLISYSAYLWHQPLFAYARLRSLNPPSDTLILMLMVLTLLLAIFTWRYIERPFRQKQRFERKQIFKLAITVSLLMSTLAAVVFLNNGFERYRITKKNIELLKTATASTHRKACHAGPEKLIDPSAACEYYGSQVSWATIGDSHAVELTDALADELKPFDTGVKHLSFSACKPSYNQRIADNPCSIWTQKAVNFIIQNNEIKTVVVGYRLNAHLFGKHEKFYPGVPDLKSQPERQEIWNSLVSMLEAFVAAEKKVVLVLQAPEVKVNVKRLIFFSADDETRIAGVTRKWWDERQTYVKSKLEEIPAAVIVMDPASLFCDVDYCFAVENGAALYFDDDHLTSYGARRIASEILESVKTN